MAQTQESGSARPPAEASAQAGGGLAPDPPWALHGQLTNVTQSNRPFRSPYSGPESLKPNGPTEETTDLTLYAGTRLWKGAELWANVELDQGFGLSNTAGVAGFPSGEAYKVGADRPYLRLPRVFMRQVFALAGSATRPVEPEANQLGGAAPADNVTLTLGKFSVVDVFDTNTYAHDPRTNFLNWSVIEAGAFDYAADPWGYTYGVAVEWTRADWTLRGGWFQLSALPNSEITGFDPSRYMLVAEVEERHRWADQPGKLKWLAFVNRAAMGRYADAVQFAALRGILPEMDAVRRWGWRPGTAVNVEQALTSWLGAFVRASLNDGSKETYEFTEINGGVAAGVAVQGDPWGRHRDTVGLAGSSNHLSNAAKSYFAAGGTGILIGDGRLDYAPERIAELYYAAGLTERITFTLDYQHISNPAYNRDRGPVSVIGLRLHAEF